MRRATAYSKDGCRARYDHIIFAAERCQSDGHGEAPSSERRWMLELGAMSVLEAELETLRLERASAEGVPRADDGGEQGYESEEEQDAYRSCLETMLDDHYDTLCEFITTIWSTTRTKLNTQHATRKQHNTQTQVTQDTKRKNNDLRHRRTLLPPMRHLATTVVRTRTMLTMLGWFHSNAAVIGASTRPSTAHIAVRVPCGHGRRVYVQSALRCSCEYTRYQVPGTRVYDVACTLYCCK